MPKAERKPLEPKQIALLIVGVVVLGIAGWQIASFFSDADPAQSDNPDAATAATDAPATPGAAAGTPAPADRPAPLQKTIGTDLAPNNVGGQRMAPGFKPE